MLVDNKFYAGSLPSPEHSAVHRVVAYRVQLSEPHETDTQMSIRFLL